MLKIENGELTELRHTNGIWDAIVETIGGLPTIYEFPSLVRHGIVVISARKKGQHTPTILHAVELELIKYMEDNGAGEMPKPIHMAYELAKKNGSEAMTTVQDEMIFGPCVLASLQDGLFDEEFVEELTLEQVKIAKQTLSQISPDGKHNMYVVIETLAENKSEIDEMLEEIKAKEFAADFFKKIFE